jgi:hypothetical protein
MWLRDRRTRSASFPTPVAAKLLRSLWRGWAGRWSWSIIQASLVVSHATKLQVQRISNTCGSQALEHHTGFIGGLTRNKTTGTEHFPTLVTVKIFERNLLPAWAGRWSWSIIQASLVVSHATKLPYNAIYYFMLCSRCKVQTSQICFFILNNLKTNNAAKMELHLGSETPKYIFKF